MRVLVTGAGGFVGSSLVPYLRNKGHEVVPVSRRELAGGYVIPEVGPETEWTAALGGVDAVVHLAARAHVLKDVSDDALAEHRRVNTEGTRRLVEQCGKQGIGRFVFISSIGVLGNNSLRSKNGHAYTEEDDPCPHDDYSQSKWEAEKAIEGVPAVVIRPPLIYGPGLPGNLRRLVRLAQRRVPFPMGMVRNQRSLLGMDNLCSLVEICLTKEEAVGQCFLAADEETVSTAGLFGKISRTLGVEPRILPVPEPLLRAVLTAAGKAKMAERLCDTLVVDATKAKRVLGWSPEVPLDEGLRKAVA